MERIFSPFTLEYSTFRVCHGAEHLLQKCKPFISVYYIYMIVGLTFHTNTYFNCGKPITLIFFLYHIPSQSPLMSLCVYDPVTPEYF